MLRVQPDFVGREHEGLACAFHFGGCGGFLVCFVVCGCGLVLFCFFKGGIWFSGGGSRKKCKLVDFIKVLGKGD